MFAKLESIVRGLKQKWGSVSIKRRMWNHEHAVCQWKQEEEAVDAPLCERIGRYARKGSILDLGCGAGNTVCELGGAYERYTGVDVSDVALEKAAIRSMIHGGSSRVSFLQSDIVNFQPKEAFNVILFRESIYYVPFRRLRKVLDRYAGHLKEDGVFIVTVFDSIAYAPLLAEIETYFPVAEKYVSAGSTQTILVFRGRPESAPEVANPRSIFTVGSLHTIYEYLGTECGIQNLWNNLPC